MEVLEGFQIGKALWNLRQGCILIRALKSQEEVSELQLGGILEGGVAKAILILLAPIHELLMLLTVFRVVQCVEIQFHGRAAGGTCGLDAGNRLGTALPDHGLRTGGDLVEFLQECGFVLRSRRILCRDARHGGEDDGEGGGDIRGWGQFHRERGVWEFVRDRSICTVISGGQWKRAATPADPLPREV